MQMVSSFWKSNRIKLAQLQSENVPRFLEVMYLGFHFLLGSSPLLLFFTQRFPFYLLFPAPLPPPPSPLLLPFFPCPLFLPLILSFLSLPLFNYPPPTHEIIVHKQFKITLKMQFVTFTMRSVTIEHIIILKVETSYFTVLFSFYLY